MLSISRSLRHLTIASAALILVALTGGASVIASPTYQTPTPQATRPILLTDPVPEPHQQGVQWFAPTGHTLRGAFLDYWNRYGGLAQFGYPITEEFTEPNGPDNKPLDVQYFERSRFEHHPENAGTPYEVVLGRLGLDFYPTDKPATPLPSPARYYEQTGHNLSGPFLAYWDNRGGLFVHGFPITEQLEEVNPIDHKKYTVQYFERSRFEYHHEYAGSQYEVLLGLLGTQLAQKKGYPYGWYPLYGHAPDFSWIAGDIRAYEDPGSALPDAGCSTFRYDYEETGKRVQLNIPGGRVSYRLSLSQERQKHLVVFGRLAQAGEAIYSCSVDRHIPVYYVNWIQGNPASSLP